MSYQSQCSIYFFVVYLTTLAVAKIVKRGAVYHNQFIWDPQAPSAQQYDQWDCGISWHLKAVAWLPRCRGVGGGVRKWRAWPAPPSEQAPDLLGPHLLQRERKVSTPLRNPSSGTSLPARLKEVLRPRTDLSHPLQQSLSAATLYRRRQRAELSLCTTPSRRNRGSGGIAPPFLTSALDVSVLSPSRPGCFIPGEIILDTHWLVLRAGLDVVEKRVVVFPAGNRTPIPRPSSQRSADMRTELSEWSYAKSYGENLKLKLDVSELISCDRPVPNNRPAAAVY
jgi:hypothetical protein